MPAGETEMLLAARGNRGRPAGDAASLGPVRRTNLSAAIADRIAESIAQGKLPAGSRLQSERELSDLFGVGRSSIREAIKTLESRGLVEGRQGEGRFVRAQDLAGLVRPPAGPLSVSEREVAQLYEARRIIEPGMAALAAERGGRRDLAAARRLLERHEERVNAGSYGGAEDTAFHLKVAAMAENPLLARLLEAVLQALHAIREPALRSTPSIKLSLAGHWRVLEALEAHDPDAAQNAALAHLDRARRLALDVVRASDGTAEGPSE
ncbi:MAG TPA: FadR/GntR family transcriptional regulator [Dehalococcoidia bacterium]|nr:FadR/GntR family transcriptional regulator [Dehalococcoidia bacterium]